MPPERFHPERKFTGPVELRQVLLNRKSDFLRHLSGKVLGFALGRSLQDGDLCSVQKLVDAIERDNYGARTLVREIVPSVPFRNTQGGVQSTGLEKPQLKRSTRKLLGEK